MVRIIDSEAAVASENFACLLGCGLCCLCQPMLFGPYLEDWRGYEETAGCLEYRELDGHEAAFVPLQSGQGACVMLQDRRCTHYTHRSWHCRAYPYQFFIGPGVINATITLACPGIMNAKETGHKNGTGTDPEMRQGIDWSRAPIHLAHLFSTILSAHSDSTGTKRSRWDRLTLQNLLTVYPPESIKSNFISVRKVNSQIHAALETNGTDIPWPVLQTLLISLTDRFIDGEDLATAFEWSLDLDGCHSFRAELMTTLSLHQDYDSLNDGAFETNDFSRLLTSMWREYRENHDPENDILGEAASELRNYCASENLRELPIWLDEELRWLLFRAHHEDGSGARPFRLCELHADGTVTERSVLQPNTDWSTAHRLTADARSLLEQYLRLVLYREVFHGHVLWLAAEQQFHWPLIGPAVYALSRISAAVQVRTALIATALGLERSDARAMYHALCYFDQEFYALPFIGALL